MLADCSKKKIIPNGRGANIALQTAVKAKNLPQKPELLRQVARGTATGHCE
jgi:hypothetical protein